jgi:hypothetical protein
MIRYSLRCKNGHAFEAWFRSGADYDKGGGSACPVCGSKKVEKALMAPALARSTNVGNVGMPEKSEKPEASEKPDKVTLAAAPDPRLKAMREALKEIRRHVVENAEHVGDRFAEEARKMHYDEIEPRAIYGEATGEEAQALAEEGIEFQPLPSLPEDQN